MSRPLAKAKKRIEGSLLLLPDTFLFHVKRFRRHLFVCANFCRGLFELSMVPVFHVKQYLG